MAADGNECIDVRLQRLSGAEATIRLPHFSTVGVLREAAGVWCNSGEAQVYIALDEEVLEQDNLAVASLAPRLAKYAVAVSSCTAGLHISCKALGFNKNSTLLTSPISFVSSSNVAYFLGGKSKFVDIKGYYRRNIENSINFLLHYEIINMTKVNIIILLL